MRRSPSSRWPASSASAWPAAGPAIRLGHRDRSGLAARPRRRRSRVTSPCSPPPRSPSRSRRSGSSSRRPTPGSTVTFSFAGQLGAGQPDHRRAPPPTSSRRPAPTTMDAVVAAGAAADPTVFADERHGDRRAARRTRARSTGVDVAGRRRREDRAVPAAGAVRRRRREKVFANAGVTVKPVTLEPDVKSVLSKVQLGEVDAGVVYVTDVLAAGDEVSRRRDPRRRQRLDRATRSPRSPASANAATAAAFVDYVLSPAGASVLTAAGFQQP